MSRSKGRGLRVLIRSGSGRCALRAPLRSSSVRSAHKDQERSLHYLSFLTALRKRFTHPHPTLLPHFVRYATPSPNAPHLMVQVPGGHWHMHGSHTARQISKRAGKAGGGASTRHASRKARQFSKRAVKEKPQCDIGIAYSN